MKKMILILSVLAGMGLTAAAQKTENHLAGNVRMERNAPPQTATTVRWHRKFFFLDLDDG